MLLSITTSNEKKKKCDSKNLLRKSLWLILQWRISLTLPTSRLLDYVLDYFFLYYSICMLHFSPTYVLLRISLMYLYKYGLILWNKSIKSLLPFNADLCSLPAAVLSHGNSVGVIHAISCSPKVQKKSHEIAIPSWSKWTLLYCKKGWSRLTVS